MLAVKQDVKNYTQAEIQEIVLEAKTAAYAAAQTYEADVMLGGWGACGFAWVNIYNIRGNTRVGRFLKDLGIRKDYTGGLCLWNPSQFPTQNIDTLEAGAQAAAKVLKHYGFDAYAGSRLD